MNSLFSFDWSDPQAYEIAVKFGKVVIVLLIGFVISRIFNFWLKFVYRNTLDRQKIFILQKMARYSLAIVTIIMILKIFGVDLKVILGAAGVLSLALGFAAQTSVSNLISGLFLIFEKPFVVGDFIEVSDIKGEVLSIDLLSMRIKTVNNLLVRVPNEAVMKSTVVNYSFFPIRRYELFFSVSYKENLDRVHQILLTLVENNKYCLDDPQPLFLVEKMGEYFLEVKFAVWGEAKDMVSLQSSFCQDVRAAFVQNKIELPLKTMRLEADKMPTNSNFSQ